MASDSEIPSESQPRFRRLQKRNENAPPEGHAETLTDALTKLSLGAGCSGRFASKVASLRKVADWSSEDDSDGCIAPTVERPEPVTDSDSEASARGEAVKQWQPKSSNDLASGTEARQKQSEEPPSSGISPAAPALTLGKCGEFKLNGAVAGLLYAHQVRGVEWLWSLHKMQKGGILGDDMGLGKTLQCSAFLAGMLQSNLMRRALIVAPKTLLAQWKKELQVSGIRSITHELSPQSTQTGRDVELAAVFSEPGVLLTTYGMVQHNAELLCKAPYPYEEEEEDSGRPLWDFLILDEGHKIKNAKTKIAQQLREIPVAVAVIISGTPIQNNLMELFVLFDFVCPGLLGDRRFFKREYEQIITRGNSKDATGRDRDLAGGRSRALRERYAPYFLRREKKDILRRSEESGEREAEGAAPVPQRMGRKNDLVVWLKLQPAQRKIYEAFLNSQAVKDTLNRSQSPLAAITVLKKVCVHPYLLSERAADAVITGGGKLAKGKQVVTDDDFIVDDDDSSFEYETERSESGADEEDGASATDPGVDELWAEWAEGVAVEEKLRGVVKSKGTNSSCKSLFAASLLKELQAKGHRTLIFSQSRVMLDIMGLELKQMKIRFSRIDGTLSAARREDLVQEFQGRADIPVMLLTSQVGGLGLTLTAADRVIILDPAWNPATDDQSVDRAYRIGQSRDVVIYRLICCGTVEEKIYRKQVFKGGLSRHGTEEGIPFQYFTEQELRDLFRVDPEELERSVTQQQLHKLHASERNTTQELREHLARLDDAPCFSGVSDHDLLFSQKVRASECSTEAGPVFPAVSGRQAALKVSSPRPAGGGPRASGKSANKGWQGASDISDCLANSLNLGGSKSDARPPGEGWAQPKPRLVPASESGAKELSQLREQAQRTRVLLGYSSKLPDGGQQLRDKLNSLEQQIAKLDCGPSNVVVLSTPEPARWRGGVSTLADDGRDEVLVLTDGPEHARPAAGASRDLYAEGPPTASGAGAARGAYSCAPSALGSEGGVDAKVPSMHTVWPADLTAEAVEKTRQTGSSIGVSEPRTDAAAAAGTPLPGDSTFTKGPATVERVPAATFSELEALRQESAALKKQIRQIKDVFDDPIARKQLPDGGKQMKKRAKLLSIERDAIKERMEALLQK